MLSSALQWRLRRKPYRYFSCPASEEPRLFGTVEEETKLIREACTGKIYLNGYDIYGRHVVVFDNDCQNTKNTSENLDLLAFTLELAVQTLPPGRDKYVVFIHLGNFSFFNMPDLQTTKETALMLTTAYPERLGHCIAYQPPGVFHKMFNLLRSLGLLDDRTVQKVQFITGDVSRGSQNDRTLIDILGPNWRELSGVDQPVLVKGCSAGFTQEDYWSRIKPALLWLQDKTNLLYGNSKDSETTTPEMPRKQPLKGQDQSDKQELDSAEGLRWDLGYDSDTQLILSRLAHGAPDSDGSDWSDSDDDVMEEGVHETLPQSHTAKSPKSSAKLIWIWISILVLSVVAVWIAFGTTEHTVQKILRSSYHQRILAFIPKTFTQTICTDPPLQQSLLLPRADNNTIVNGKMLSSGNINYLFQMLEILTNWFKSDFFLWPVSKAA